MLYVSNSKTPKRQICAVFVSLPRSCCMMPILLRSPLRSARYVLGFESAAGSGSSLSLEAQAGTRRDIDDDRDLTWISPGFHRLCIEVIAFPVQLRHTSSVTKDRPAAGVLEEVSHVTYFHTRPFLSFHIIGRGF